MSDKYKKRILFCGEASFLNTGFSTYYRELLPRLAKTGKYEIAEMGSYANQADPRIYDFIRNRWTFYGVEAIPTPNRDSSDELAYRDPQNQSPRAPGQNTCQFGDYRFQYACADFKPDIVVDIRDWWMLEYIERSAFRPYFKWIAMPTVDAEPQREEWIATYRTANLCLAYSDFGVHVLKSYPGVKVWNKPTRPGVDLDVFHPMDQKELKKDWLGCQDDVRVILMVARNQSRKLFPDALNAFALMKEKYKGVRAVDKAVFVVHSSWPDNQHSYDYPRHIARMHTGHYGLEYYNMPTKSKKQSKKKPKGGIMHDVFQTYMCRKCNHVFLGWAIHLYDKPVEYRVPNEAGKIYIQCQKCGENWATTPDTSRGYDREQLARLYAMADMFVQVTICEGDGMPIQEAKACGCPTLVVDYSAMAEKGRFHDEYVHFKDKDFNKDEYTVHHGGAAIPVERFYYEPETSCKRALPDTSELADQMYELLTDDKKRNKMRVDARRCVEENYDWDKLVQEWEYVLDNMDILDRSTTWDKTHKIVETRKAGDIPEGLNDSEFIDHLYLKVLKYPKVDDAGKQHWLAALEAGESREAVCRAFEQVIGQEVKHQNAVNALLATPEKDPNKLDGEMI